VDTVVSACYGTSWQVGSSKWASGLEGRGTDDVTRGLTMRTRSPTPILIADESW
jgi:hypothetical protein